MRLSPWSQYKIVPSHGFIVLFSDSHALPSLTNMQSVLYLYKCIASKFQIKSIKLSKLLRLTIFSSQFSFFTDLFLFLFVFNPINFLKMLSLSLPSCFAFSSLPFLLFCVEFMLD